MGLYLSLKVKSMEEANQRETIDSGNRWRLILKDKEVRITFKPKTFKYMVRPSLFLGSAMFDAIASEDGHILEK